MNAREMTFACLIAAALALVAVWAGIAWAGEGSRQTSRYTLSTKLPGHSAAERFRFDYVNPDDPAAKPPAVRRVETILPHGARYDTSAPGSCTASDAELTARGSAACPADSAIGGGVVTVDTGVPGDGRIVTADVEFFNNAEDPDGEFIYLNTVRGTGARTVIRADVTLRRTITQVEALPGTPPDGGAIDTVDVTVADVSRVVDGVRRRYITTPRRCPSDGRWIARVSFAYEDGVTQTMPTANRCARRGRRPR
ncbi:MAG: hypothetical protein M3340_17915 [Actinomycetota bacterium]|nr:hypothetical protein [Actinomycetota bacterium]